VKQCCGFVPIEAQLRQLPIFTLFGDGRVFLPGPQIEIYPPPALPSITVTPIAEPGVQAILRGARDAGLMGPDRHFDLATVTDASTTTFTLVADGGRHETSVYALDPFGGGPDEAPAGVPADQREVRQALAEFQRKLGDLRSWLPDGSVGEEGLYEPEELRIFVQPGEPPQEPELQQPPAAWPLDAPLAAFGEPVEGRPDLRCASIRGEDLPAILPLATTANELTPWTSGAKAYSLVLRPLLPHESGCEGLDS
jgi:hypothetical protein